MGSIGFDAGHRARWLFAIGAVALLTLAPVQAANLSGTVRLTERNKPVRQSEDVVVYFRPDTPVATSPAESPLVMSTHRKQFAPRVLVTTTGSSVRFPNQDPILHNVFSVSGDNQFDVGLYGEGSGETVRFDHAGLVRVYCNVHQSMIGHILVLDTPFFAKADASGQFRLVDLPEVPGKFYVWHERVSRPLVLDLSLPLDDPLDLELSLDRRRVPAHMNKDGKPYRNDRRRY